MDSVLLSSLIGLVTYMVLKSSPLDSNDTSDSKDTKKVDDSTKKGGDKCDILPECFKVSKLGSSLIQQIRDKCETEEYKQIISAYIKIFCFEMALENKEISKVNNFLTEIRNKYNLADVMNIEEYLSDSFKNINTLLIKLNASNVTKSLNNDVKKHHQKMIFELFSKIIKL
jgi:hypothetical protein